MRNIRDEYADFLIYKLRRNLIELEKVTEQDNLIHKYLLEDSIALCRHALDVLNDNQIKVKVE